MILIFITLNKWNGQTASHRNAFLLRRELCFVHICFPLGSICCCTLSVFQSFSVISSTTTSCSASFLFFNTWCIRKQITMVMNILVFYLLFNILIGAYFLFHWQPNAFNLHLLKASSLLECNGFDSICIFSLNLYIYISIYTLTYTYVHI